MTIIIIIIIIFVYKRLTDATKQKIQHNNDQQVASSTPGRALLG